MATLQWRRVRLSVMGCVMWVIVRVLGFWLFLVTGSGLYLFNGGEAQAASPLECGLTQMGVRSHIECKVMRDRIAVRQVHLNNGECRTMQEHYELNPKELERLKKLSGQQISSYEYRRSYRVGQSFVIYLMPCHLRDYVIDTDQGTWGWVAQRQ